jgi:ribosomal protein L14E/L6E/L27E
LAEAGCSTHEIASITGHASLKELERYTKAVDQKKLATAAMGKVRAKPEQKFTNLTEGLTIRPKNKPKSKGRDVASGRPAHGGIPSQVPFPPHRMML